MIIKQAMGENEKPRTAHSTAHSTAHQPYRHAHRQAGRDAGMAPSRQTCLTAAALPHSYSLTHINNVIELPNKVTAARGAPPCGMRITRNPRDARRAGGGWTDRIS